MPNTGVLMIKQLTEAELKEIGRLFRRHRSTAKALRFIADQSDRFNMSAGEFFDQIAAYEEWKQVEGTTNA